MVMIVYATSILFVSGIVAKGAGMSSWMSLFIALAFGLLVAVLSSSLGLKVSR
ncbi:spore germination protein KB [Desulforamulus putei DSM 12395]|uniref:Spore germination protein KB n=2 Tax=Desulforamulus putei TaxID=74701 RepID=A0A1M4Z1M7_9FIRM|nr:spore germination protein KB [Desulforamulus putei DSM 12395]